MEQTICDLYDLPLAASLQSLSPPSVGPSPAAPPLDAVLLAALADRRQLRTAQARLAELSRQWEDLDWDEGADTPDRRADCQQLNGEKLVRVLRERERAAAPLTVSRRMRPMVEFGHRQLAHQQSALRVMAGIKHRLDHLVRLRQTDPNAVEAVLSVNVVLAVDCTASMREWRALLVQCLPELVRGVKQAVPISTLRVGFVGYRDCLDVPRYLLQPVLVSTSLPLLQDWISQLPLEGGGDDCPENVIGGLHMAAQLLADHCAYMGDSAVRTSCVVLMGDSPAHGPSMHAAAMPDSDDNLRAMAADPSIGSAHSVLQELSGAGTELAVVRLNSSVDDMLAAFRASFDDAQRPHHLAVLDASVAPDQPRSWEERRAELAAKLAAFVSASLRKTILRLSVDSAAAVTAPPSPS